MCRPNRPSGPSAARSSWKNHRKERSTKELCASNSHGKDVRAAHSLFPFLSSFSLLRSKGIRWAAAQTCLRDFIPQTPIFASRAFKLLCYIPIMQHKQGAAFQRLPVIHFAQYSPNTASIPASQAGLTASIASGRSKRTPFSLSGMRNRPPASVTSSAPAA